MNKMPDTGHFIPMEKPEELSEIILEFIEKQKSQKHTPNFSRRYDPGKAGDAGVNSIQ